MKLRWLCMRFVGSPRWQNTEVYEPDECGTEFVTDEQDFVTCPGCKEELSVEDDCPEEINE